MKTWPIDLFVLRNIQLEVSEKFPQGELACGSQAFIATLLFDPSMSALPRQPLQGLMIIWGGAMVCVGGGRHPPKRRNSMVSRVHVHQFTASVWRAARSNVASRTYKKKAWNELVGPARQRPAKSQKRTSKSTLRNAESAWCRGFTCTNFRPPF